MKLRNVIFLKLHLVAMEGLCNLPIELLSLITHFIFDSTEEYNFKHPKHIGIFCISAPQYRGLLQTCRHLHGVGTRALSELQFRADYSIPRDIGHYSTPTIPDFIKRNLRVLTFYHEVIRGLSQEAPLQKALQAIDETFTNLKETTLHVGIQASQYGNLELGELYDHLCNKSFSLFDGILWKRDPDSKNIVWLLQRVLQADLWVTFQFSMWGPVNGRLLLFEVAHSHRYGSNHPHYWTFWTEVGGWEPCQPPTNMIMNSNDDGNQGSMENSIDDVTHLVNQPQSTPG